MRGIIFAGDGVAGAAGQSQNRTRTRTDTDSALPQILLPVHGQPLIYFPLGLLRLAGIQHILIVATPRDAADLQHHLGGGERWGIHLSYALQCGGGAARALMTASEFTGDQPVALALGNQVFHGQALPAVLQNAATHKQGARLFVKPAHQNHTGQGGRCALVSLDENGKPVELAELAEGSVACPAHHALTGLYFYDNTVTGRARGLWSGEGGCSRPDLSALHTAYLAEGNLAVEVLDDGITWLTIDTPAALRAAAASIKAAGDIRCAGCLRQPSDEPDADSACG